VLQTNPKVIERCILMSSDPGDLILDPTCDSGTTAFVAEQLGRCWITTDTTRVALALARTRLMAGRFTYYVLADSPEGIQKEAELTGTVPNRGGKTESDVKKGFVYERIPHITLKSIAQNDEIDVIYAQHEDKLEPIREKLNGIKIRDDSSLKLFRIGDTPVLRGTAFVRNQRNAALWTRGWTPRLGTYPGLEVPNPLSVEFCRGDAAIETV
jgi:hypothetical protein